MGVREELASKVKYLERQLMEAKAASVSNAHFVIPKLKKLGKARMMGSSVTLEIQSLGGRITTSNFSISDGLSQKTIDALIEDLERDYKHKCAYTPSGLAEIPDFT
jgi:hypothetical protein